MTEPAAGGALPAVWMQIHVNGDPTRIPVVFNIEQLLSHLGAPTAGSAVELNGRIVPRSAHPTTVVKAGDRLEIVTFVGGG